MSVPGGLILGWVAGILMTLLVAIVASTLISTEKAGEGICAAAGAIAAIVAAWTGSVFAGGCVENKKMMVSMISGLLYFLTLLVLNLSLFGGAIRGWAPAAVTIAASSLVAGLQVSRQTSRTKRRSKVVKRR